MAVLNMREGLRHIRHHGGLLEIPPLPESTILLVEVGSTAPGTGLPGGEDHDEMVSGNASSSGQWMLTCQPGGEDRHRTAPDDAGRVKHRVKHRPTPAARHPVS